MVGALKTKEAIEKETIPPENVASAEKEANVVIEAATKPDKGKEVANSGTSAEPDPKQQNTDKETEEEGSGMSRLCRKLDQDQEPDSHRQRQQQLESVFFFGYEAEVSDTTQYENVEV
ncbi:hypothetical protein RIF29_14864 [Crotalaria pallida]|uniref:Uncharacterized protein n=1 Tax=Crotalaria pallida TaxID=3830 RepID=A0AAN9FEK0_CROPI